MTFQIPRVPIAASAAGRPEALGYGTPEVIAKIPLTCTLKWSRNPATSSIRICGERLIEPGTKRAQATLGVGGGIKTSFPNFRGNAYHSETNSLEGSTGSSRVHRRGNDRHCRPAALSSDGFHSQRLGARRK